MTLLHPTRRRLLVVVVTIAAVLGALVVPSPTSASSPAAGPATAWLAGLVGPDGSVENPYDPGVPSVSWTVNVALSLATTGTQPEALDAAMGYLEARVDDYAVVGGVDNPGRLGYLTMLAVATERDPRAFGSPGTDLVGRTLATYEVSETGLFGVPDSYSSATLQSLAVLGLVAAGETVPAGSLGWLADQQCGAGEGPAETLGGWQGYRAPEGAGLADCVVVGDPEYLSPDSNNTSFAVQALAATDALGLLDTDPGTFFSQLQEDDGTHRGGFAFDLLSFGADPNSTAVVLQALVALGEPLGEWAVGGQDPLVSLETWVIASGADAGALSSPFSDGFADVFATYQGVWGLALAPFPLPVPPPPPASTTTTTSTTSTTTEVAPASTAPTPSGPGVVVTPRFTG
ncbi:hypothetical protein [Rhabdothermincola salaria]|uniref:hypothetical protein n=1 Tax=Rhabdothermincola salaria TaxID=2903142 RepID=UPI001E656290|nr:hypothetical protein [Rhabdothermincola salaria]MCD9623096.1 hypothetical protein [Rhabdothermincola salaria]